MFRSTRSRLVGALALASSLALGGCVGANYKDIRVETEADPKVNFDGYTTYQWAGSAAVVRDPLNRWAPSDLDVDAEIRFLIDRELRARGMTEVVRNADVLVVYGVGVDMESMRVVVQPGEDTEELRNVPTGGVQVVLADPRSRSVMWVGSAVADIREEPDDELAKNRLDFAVRKMFEKFPN